MAKFLIEVPHEATMRECALAVQAFFETGSHFIPQMDWGCSDGVHKAWIIVEVDSKKEALYIVPPAYRPNAIIVELNKFTVEEIDDFLKHHKS
jgi:hypothetical protein